MLVPDTLDLRDRARLAIGHMTANHDHQTGYPYFYINVTTDPPVATHNAWDTIDVTSRYIDSLLLAREMTGDTAGTEVEEGFRRILVQSLHPNDGLAYRPETPWCVGEAEMFDQSRALNALVTWYLMERQPETKALIDRMVEGLWSIAIHIARRRAGHSFCYFPYPGRFPDAWNPTVPGEPCCYNGGALILPLVTYAAATGNERALELGRRFMHYIVDESHIFRPDGSFWPDEMHLAAGHFHTRSLSMAGVLEYALLVGKPELVEWVRRAFDWAMATSCGSFGWFPEGIGTEHRQTTKHSETCNITDMLHVALRLAEAGYEEYWTHAERFTRNHLLESQWSRKDWLKPRKDSLPDETAQNSYVDMDARIMGGYAGRTLPNEFVVDGVMMGCCCGAGPRALYQAWEKIMTRRDDGLYVNLPLNRFGPDADVLSWLPHEGRVEVRLRSPGPLFVRTPGGGGRERARGAEGGDGAVAVERNGEAVPFSWSGSYVRIEEAGAGDQLAVRFPLEVKTRDERLLDWDLRIRWRGDTVVSMTPPGKRLPLYERAALDSEVCPMRE